MEYRGFIIEKETDPWALHFDMTYRFQLEGDEVLHGASSLEDAKDQIDELVNVREAKQLHPCGQ
jgi:hypothetical protein